MDSAMSHYTYFTVSVWILQWVLISILQFQCVFCDESYYGDYGRHLNARDWYITNYQKVSEASEQLCSRAFTILQPFSIL